MISRSPPFPDTDAPASGGVTRRRFLQLGLAAPLVAVTLSVPMALMAAPVDVPSLPFPERKPKAPRLLMIDPGHGGFDPGAIGRSGTQEKDVTLDIARRMAEALAKNRGVDAKLTRDDDDFMPLKERVKLSESVRADLFVSIHADSAPNSGARGLSVYTLSEKASDAFASQLADRENHADVAGGLDLPVTDQQVAAILFDLTARRTRNTAQRAKIDFIKGIGRHLRLLESPVRAANFAVLRTPDVPAMLVETGFLSNPHDESVLRQPKERQKIAEAMAREFTALLESPLFG